MVLVPGPALRVRRRKDMGACHSELDDSRSWTSLAVKKSVRGPRTRPLEPPFSDGTLFTELFGSLVSKLLVTGGWAIRESTRQPL